jgi:hypothetical protein
MTYAFHLGDYTVSRSSKNLRECVQESVLFKFVVHLVLCIQVFTVSIGFLCFFFYSGFVQLCAAMCCVVQLQALILCKIPSYVATRQIWQHLKK